MSTELSIHAPCAEHKAYKNALGNAEQKLTEYRADILRLSKRLDTAKDIILELLKDIEEGTGSTVTTVSRRERARRFVCQPF